MVEKKEETALVEISPPKTLNELFTSDYIRMAIQKAAPKHLSAERFLRIANTSMNQNPKLMKCTVSSVWDCIFQLSSLGLEPDGRNAHLIPYKDKCTLVIDYKGIVDVVRRSGEVSIIHADIVCENDIFEFDRGIVSKHIINLREPRGDMYAAYSQVIFKDRAESYEVMSLDEIHKIRNSSPAYSWAEKGEKSKGGGKKDSTWHKYPGEMSKKTVFRRHSKWLPFSSEIRRVIEADDQHLFPDIASRTISGDDIVSMPDGTRMKIKPPVQDAETEPTIEDMKVDLQTMDSEKYYALCEQCSIDPSDKKLIAEEETIKTLYAKMQEG